MSNINGKKGMVAERDGIVSFEKENALFTKAEIRKYVCDEERKENMFYLFVGLFHCIEFKL